MREVDCMFCEGIGQEVYVWECTVCYGEGKLLLHEDVNVGEIERNSWQEDF